MPQVTEARGSKNRLLWLAEPGATLTPLFPKITIPYNPLLFHNIWPRRKATPIGELLVRAEKYTEMLKTGKVKSQAEMARQEGITKARLTQIMNLLKLAPRIKEYLKNLNDPALLRYFNEKRLRPIASIKDKQNQLEKFEELKRKIEIKESINKMSYL